MFKPNTPTLAVRYIILTMGCAPWAACSPETAATGGRAVMTAAPRAGAPQSGVGGSSALAANTANSAGGSGNRATGAGAGSDAAGISQPASGPRVSGASGATAGMSALAGASAAGSSSAPAASGCGVEPVPSGSGTIQVDGMARTYQFSVPQGYDNSRPYPLLFSFHGAGVPAATFRTYFNMTQVVGGDAIVVYPEALGNPIAWDTQRDIPLFDALLTQFKSQYCVDDKHIFAAGHSSGGFFTHALGCQRGNVLRGIGPLSAGPPFGNCVGQIAVWISQGNADMTVKPESGRMARDFWAKRNHCDTSMSKPVDPAPTVEYAGCDAGFGVRYCEYDGDHNLPAYAPKGIWDFFKTL